MLRTFSNSLQHRRRQAELMDNPELQKSLHDQALAGLRRINRWSRTGAAVWTGIRDLLKSDSAGQPLTILDLACGSGDMALWLARRLQQFHCPFLIHGVDISSTAVAAATQQATAAAIDGLSFHQWLLPVAVRIAGTDARRDQEGT